MPMTLALILSFFRPPAQLPVPRAATSTIAGSSYACVVTTARETATRGWHGVTCADSFGVVTGVLLTRTGKLACTFGGTYDGHCLTLTGCVSGFRCN